MPVNTEGAVYTDYNAVVIYLGGRENASSQEAPRLLREKDA